MRALVVGIGLALGVASGAGAAQAENTNGARILISAPATVRGWGEFKVNCQTSHHLAGAKVKLVIANDGILKDTRTVAPNGNCSMPVLIQTANGGVNKIKVVATYKGRKIVSNRITVEIYPKPPA